MENDVLNTTNFLNHYHTRNLLPGTHYLHYLHMRGVTILKVRGHKSEVMKVRGHQVAKVKG